MRSFGIYHDLEEIGRGGMATVYRAVGPDGRPVALKILARHLANDTTARLRFLQESRFELIHPHIVHVLKYGIEGDVPYIVMEYVEGESLDRRIQRRGTLGISELLPILADVARALDFAHRRGVIHRDVKPSNILIRANGQALLGDFGVAKVTDYTAYTATAVRVGSAFFMSPEQARGVPHLTGASDVYSLGVTAYVALSGRYPFEADNDIAIARMHIDQEPRPLSAVNPRISPAVSDAVHAALAKFPVGRPATAAEFVRRIERAYASQSVVLAPGGPIPPPPAYIPPRTLATPDGTPARGASSMGWAGLAGLAVACLLVTLIAGALVTDPDRNTPAWEPTVATRAPEDLSFNPTRRPALTAPAAPTAPLSTITITPAPPPAPAAPAASSTQAPAPTRQAAPAAPALPPRATPGPPASITPWYVPTRQLTPIIPTETPTLTPTPTPTLTATATSTATPVPTSAATATETATAMPTVEPTATETATPIPTDTPAAPTETPTLPPEPTETPTQAPTEAPTPTPP